MTLGHIYHLRSKLLHKRIGSNDIFNFFNKRIQIDKQAFESQSVLSALNVTPTNSILDFVSSLPENNYERHLSDDQLSLYSIPITVKDNFSVDFRTFGLRTTCASVSLKNFKSGYNASVVQSLLNSGCLLMAKTNMDEFAMGCGSTDGTTNGPVINPWSCNYIPHTHDNCRQGIKLIAGGSSGGSAASVASGLCLAALASDTGGSARLPAAYCGVVGFKPTYGLVSRCGLIPLANILDVPAIIASNVADVASILSCWLSPTNGLARQDDSTCLPLSSQSLTEFCSGLTTKLDDATATSKPVRIGIPVEYHVPGLNPEIGAVWDQVAGWLADEFLCSVELVRLAHTPIATSVYSILCATEVASNMSRYDGLKFGHRYRHDDASADMDEERAELVKTRLESLGPVVRSRILAGNYFLLGNRQFNRHLVAARKLWRLIKEDFDEVFRLVDFVLTPVAPSLPPTLAEFIQHDNRTRTTLDDVCTVAVNLAGLPAISIPVGMSANRGLPIGLQLIGPHFSEVRLLHLARQLERRANFKPLVDMRKLIDSI